MKVTRGVFWGSVMLAVGLPTVGAFLQGMWPAAVVLLVIGILWLSATRLQWAGNLVFALAVGGLAFSAWVGVNMGWLLPGMVAAIAAWDLAAFVARLASVARIENERELVRDHLQRLGIVSIVGLALAAAASLIRVHLSFGIALLLALFVVLGLGYVLRGISE